jgi:hypothetical protein
MLRSRTGEIQETHAAGPRICHNPRLHAFSLDRLWDSPCSCSLTQSSCLRASYAFSSWQGSTYTACGTEPNALTSCCCALLSADRKLQKDVSMMQTATYSMGHRVWTNANLAKEFVKVKTYSDLLVLRQDANDKLGEPARWVLYASYFHKSPCSDVNKARAD